MKALSALPAAAALLLGVAATAQAPAPAGRIIGVGIAVTDIDRSIRFYTEILGMKATAPMRRGSLAEASVSYGPGQGSQILLMNDGVLEGHARVPGGDGLQKIVLDVADLDRIADRLRRTGAGVDPIDMRMGVRMLSVTDPDGYRYQLIERQPAIVR